LTLASARAVPIFSLADLLKFQAVYRNKNTTHPRDQERLTYSCRMISIALNRSSMVFQYLLLFKILTHSRPISKLLTCFVLLHKILGFFLSHFILLGVVRRLPLYNLTRSLLSFALYTCNEQYLWSCVSVLI